MTRQERTGIDVSRRFEELDRRQTPMGEVSLRRRLEPSLLVDVYEVKLGDEYLMSSLFTASEVELARLGLAAVAGSDLDVVVGGLGLGCTAQAVLDDPRVGSLHVVDALETVIDWHHRHLLPLSAGLTADARCHLVHGDFFAMVADRLPFSPEAPERLDAILVDIDHTPSHHLHPSHAPFYEPTGIRRLTGRLRPGGVFALWSDDPPDDGFATVLDGVFEDTDAHVVSFPNPHTGAESFSTIYVAASPT
jgi:spermidine synthase